MKGASKIEVTHETIVAAVQMYLDSQFAEGKAPKVEAVSQQKSQYGAPAAFEVECTEAVQP